MSGSTQRRAANATSETDSAGRYLIVQPSGAGLTMMVDTVTGRSWFRIAAGSRSLRLAPDEVRALGRRNSPDSRSENRCAFTTTATPT